VPVAPRPSGAGQHQPLAVLGPLSLISPTFADARNSLTRRQRTGGCVAFVTRRKRPDSSAATAPSAPGDPHKQLSLLRVTQ